MRRAQPLALALPLGLLALLAEVTDAYEENAQAVRDLGTAKGNPVTNGFLFWKNKLVEAPYIVERRGLDILINGICVLPGPEYPAYDYGVSVDPGEPPPGSSPFDPTPPGQDPRSDYWSRKWRYLQRQFAHREAVTRMVETYRQCKSLKAVYQEPDEPDFVICETKAAGPMNQIKVLLEPDTGGRRLEKRELLARYDEIRIRDEEQLKAGRVLLFRPGLKVAMSALDSLSFMEVLNSTRSNQDKLHHLLAQRGFAPQDNHLSEIIDSFKSSEEVQKRIEQLRISSDPNPLPHLDGPSPFVRAQVPDEDQEEGGKQMDRTTTATWTGQTGITWLAVGLAGTGLVLLAWAVVRWARIHK